MRIYPIVTDNLIVKWKPRFVNETEFDFVSKSLISNKYTWKPSEDEAKSGIDNIGRYIELSLD